MAQGVICDRKKCLCISSTKLIELPMCGYIYLSLNIKNLTCKPIGLLYDKSLYKFVTAIVKSRPKKARSCGHIKRLVLIDSIFMCRLH